MDFKNERFTLEMVALANAIVSIFVSNNGNGTNVLMLLLGIIFVFVFSICFLLDLIDIIVSIKSILLYENIVIDLESISIFDDIDEHRFPMSYFGTSVGGISDFPQVYRECEVPHANLGDTYFNTANKRTYICVKAGTNLNAEWEPYDRYKERNLDRNILDMW